MKSRLKKALRRVPGLVTTYRRGRFVARLAYEGWWLNQAQLYDDLHWKQEWDFGSDIVRDRNEHILQALAAQAGQDGWGRVLELGCADGIFTAELAPRCSRLLATDISSVALALATQRCLKFPNVRFERHDLLREPLDTQGDIVVAMDLFDCLHGRHRVQRVAARIAEAVRPGGLLVFSGCRLATELRHDALARWLLEGADNLVRFLDGRFGLRLVHQEKHPEVENSVPGYIDHLIALFRKEKEQ